LDIAHSEMVEKELDAFIERRSRKGEQDPDEQEELWKVSVATYNNGKDRERAVAWYCYEKRLERLHASLAREHEAKAREWGEQVERMDKAEENGHHEKGA
jgi:hypothetical protein